MTWASCALREIEQIGHWAQGASRTVAPRAPMLLDPKIFWMHSASWSLATSNQTLDHFPIGEQLAFATLYDGIAHRQDRIEREDDQLRRILTLIPLADDAQSRRELRAALGDLKGTIAHFDGQQGIYEAPLRCRWRATGSRGLCG